MRNRGAGERRGSRLRRCSALARRDDIPLCESVNCAPTKCCVWPVLAPAEGIVRAGAGLRGRWFCRGGLPRFTPDFAVLLECFAFGSRLSFFLCQEKRDGLRCLAFLFRGSRSPSCVLAVSVRLSAFVSSLRVWIFFYGDLDGLPGCGGRGTGLAARPLCVFAQPHWRCCAFRGEYAGAARPRLRQRVECGSGTAASLDSLHLIRGVGAFYAAGTVREHSAVSWRCRQLPRRRLSASSPRAGTAPRPDNTPQPFRRRCTPHAQPARRRGSATAQRPRRTARLP